MNKSKFFHEHSDEFKMIGPHGDAFQRTMMFHYLNLRMGRFNKDDLKHFVDAMLHCSRTFKRGLFVRHPNARAPRSWFGWGEVKASIRKFLRMDQSPDATEEIPWIVSRDQLEPLIYALGMLNLQNVKKVLFRYFVRRFGVCPNITDILFPHHWACMLRMMRWRWAYPLIFVGDLFSCLASWILTKQAKENTSAKINHALHVDFICTVIPTPPARWSRRIFKRIDIQWAWTYYFETSAPARAIRPQLLFNRYARDFLLTLK